MYTVTAGLERFLPERILVGRPGPRNRPNAASLGTAATGIMLPGRRATRALRSGPIWKMLERRFGRCRESPAIVEARALGTMGLGGCLL